MKNAVVAAAVKSVILFLGLELSYPRNFLKMRGMLRLVSRLYDQGRAGHVTISRGGGHREDSSLSPDVVGREGHDRRQYNPK